MKDIDRKLIAIDPGEVAGVALFLDGTLVHAELVLGCVAQCWEWRGPCDSRVVVEVPVKRPKDKVDPNRLITLALRAGYLSGACKPAIVSRVSPETWKGQRPKSVDNARTLRILTEGEKRYLKQEARTHKWSSSERHNVLDAIGIGLWALGRKP